MRSIPSLPSRSTAQSHRAVFGALRAIILAAATVALSACSDSTGPGDSALAAAEARWRLVKPASNTYTMRQEVHCFCAFGGAEYAVTVTNGTVSGATPVSRPSEGLGPPPLTAFRTVDQLFAEVRNALGKTGTLKEVTYDEVAGYPTRLALDPLPNAIDDEVGYVTRAVGPQP
ncbi:MAG TPA: DUF6174 domain-containing protein [Gemmatimonas sp.]|uniref:DUF6174 domain-containing protein n=1 Tax=Gemmatimonas sp. TaxID=1962908 RepID=UPI002EDB1AE6